jgi:hypothetical protein
MRAGQDRPGDLPAGVVDEHGRGAGGAGRPGVTPLHERGYHREQGQALLGQQVLIALRAVRVLAPFQDALLGQLAQPCREHAARHAEARLEVVEAPGAAERVTQDQRRPPLSHHIKGPGDRAVHLGQAGQAHGDSITQ